jgi:hypothetical protein
VDLPYDTALSVDRELPRVHQRAVVRGAHRVKSSRVPHLRKSHEPIRGLALGGGAVRPRDLAAGGRSAGMDDAGPSTSISGKVGEDDRAVERRPDRGERGFQLRWDRAPLSGRAASPAHRRR